MAPKKDRKTYSRAPIVEAVIDIQVVPRPDVILQELAKIGNAERPRYPQDRLEAVEIQQTIAADGSSTEHKRRRVGWVYRSADSRQILQTRVEGFTFSRLRPYEKWEPFRDEARRLWAIYSDVTRPPKIRRVGIRYVNRFDLPTDTSDLATFLNVRPLRPPELGPEEKGFLVQLQIPQPDVDAVLVLNQARAASENPETQAIILDLDLFQAGELTSGVDGLWDLIERLHDRIEEVFEVCLTNELRRRIE